MNDITLHKHLLRLFALSLLWVFLIAPRVVHAAAVDVSGQMTLTKSGLVLNRTTNTFNQVVRLNNVSKKTLEAPVFLAISGLPAGVTLKGSTSQIPLTTANATNTQYLAIPAPVGFEPGAGIDILLQFENPKRISISYSLKIYAAAISGAAISTLEPSIASTGMLVSISGQGFSKDSIVRIGDNVIKNRIYRSSTQIQFVLPVAPMDEALATFPAGTYPVSVDDGPAIELQVTAPPENTESPGVELKRQMAAIQSSLQSEIELLRPNLPNLLASIQQPEVKQFIQAIASLDTGGLALVAALPGLADQLTPETLGILDRIVLASAATPITPPNVIVNAAPLSIAQSSLSNDLFAKTVCLTAQGDGSSKPLGDQCLSKRFELIEQLNRRISPVKAISSVCNALDLTSKLLSTTGEFPKLLKKINNASYLEQICLANEIADFILNGYLQVRLQVTSGDLVGLSLDAHNEALASTHPSAPYPNQPPKLPLSDQPESGIPSTYTLDNGRIWMQSTLHTGDMIASIFKYSSLLASLDKTLSLASKDVADKLSKLADYAGKITPDGTIGPKVDLPISLSFLDHEGYAPLTLCPGGYAEYFVVGLPRSGAGAVNIQSAPTPEFSCNGLESRFMVHKTFRQESEDEIIARFNFATKRLIKADIAASPLGSGSVKYSPLAQKMSVLNSKVGECFSNCTDFFERGSKIEKGMPSDALELVAMPKPGSVFSRWEGDCLNKTQDLCVIPYTDATIQHATALFNQNRPPIARDDSSTTKAGAAVAIDVKANDEDLDGTPRENLTITNPVVVGNAAKGTVVVQADKLLFTPATGVTGTVTLQYTLTDPQGAVSNVANVTIAVNIDDMPSQQGNVILRQASCSRHSGPSQFDWAITVSGFSAGPLGSIVTIPGARTEGMILGSCGTWEFNFNSSPFGTDTPQCRRTNTSDESAEWTLVGLFSHYFLTGNSEISEISMPFSAVMYVGGGDHTNINNYIWSDPIRVTCKP